MLDELRKRVYTTAETAEMLSVSEKTITRMVDRGNLQKLKGIGAIRIPIESVENLITASLDYNAGSAGSEVRNPRGVRKCLSARKEMVSTSKRRASSGGHLSRTQAEKELENLLELPVEKRP